MSGIDRTELTLQNKISNGTIHFGQMHCILMFQRHRPVIFYKQE